MLRALKAAGAEPFVADSPGGLNGPAKVARAYRMSGISPMCEQEGVQIIDIEDAHAQLDAPEGRLYRSFRVGRPFLEADAIVQVGVLKTHQLMRLTGGVKLTYGCIPGLTKAHLHVRAQRRDDFADMLLDLHTALAPRFTVIDGIIAMEGQGPGSGKPRRTRLPVRGARRRGPGRGARRPHRARARRHQHAHGRGPPRPHRPGRSLPARPATRSSPSASSSRRAGTCSACCRRPSTAACAT